MAKQKVRAIVDPDMAPRPALVLEETCEPTQGNVHAHRRAQLVHAAEGVITVRADGGIWVVPPQRAVWVPAGTRHAVSSQRPFRLLTLYVLNAESIPHEPRVVAVDRLVQELLAAAGRFGPDYPEGGAEARLVNVILDRLPTLTVAPLLHLQEPVTPALLRIARALVAAPANRRTLDEWAAHVKMTPRTAARRFVAETGLTFGQWRTQLRLHAALERLGAGASVTAVAFEVGYDDVSSFIAAFKAQMGDTPARYFAKGRG
jgi:AraC-like DNA-binding protein/mannose-6-phosphate isomerase-like protein (cupin superfamily)